MLVCFALPVAAHATTITVGDPSGTPAPAGATPGTQAEIVRGTATTTDPGCTYQISVQDGTSDDGTWVRDVVDSNWGTPPVYSGGDNAPAATGTADFAITVSELYPNTIYHYRFHDSGTDCPDGAGGTIHQQPAKTEDFCFLANAGAVPCPAPGQPAAKPLHDMQAPTEVSGGSATLHATHDPNGCASGSSRFEWGSTEDGTYHPDSNDTQYTSAPPGFDMVADASPNTFFHGHATYEQSLAISGLHAGWLYHTRIGSYYGCYDSDGHAAPNGTQASSERCLLAGTGPAPCQSPPAVPAPVVGKTANAAPEKGIVLLKVPGKKGFVTLTSATSIPVGSVLDTTKGQVGLSFATNTSGATQRGSFSQGQFQVAQSRKSPLTTMSMVGGGLNACKTKLPKGGAPKGLASAARKSRRTLFSSVKGHFRTRGRNSTATVRGTKWRVTDTCSGTTTSVTQGSVVVRDLTLHRNVLVKAGHSYLARAPLSKKKRH
jgi:hypothetical protein